MQVALISPTSLLDKVPATGYHLILPQLLSQPEYRHFYQTVGGYKILDNGIAEGLVYRGTDLLEMAQMVGADEIVVPDVIGSRQDTITEVERFFGTIADHALRGKFNYMVVCQGKDLTETKSCIDDIAELQKVLPIGAIGIPRAITNIAGVGTRSYLAGYIEALMPHIPIHFLGHSKFMIEGKTLAATSREISSVRGIDTSMPAVMGIAETDLDATGWVEPRQQNFFEGELSERQVSNILRNCDDFLRWFRTETPSGKV